MDSIVRLGDSSDHGGSMVSASGTFTAGGVKACLSGDSHSCPIKGHGTTPVSSSKTLTCNGISVIKTGDKAGCGATITSGSVTTS